MSVDDSGMQTEQGGAIFDLTNTYRYTLWRQWDSCNLRVTFVMLNPSTADHIHNDPTIRRCIAFAQDWGYGSLEVVNLFAYRSSDPKQLRHIDAPIGPKNDTYLLQASSRSSRVVFAWGNSGSLLRRDVEVQKLLSHCDPSCLGLNYTGQPRHPLYLPKNTSLIPFEIDDNPEH